MSCIDCNNSPLAKSGKDHDYRRKICGRPPQFPEKTHEYAENQANNAAAPPKINLGKRRTGVLCDGRFQNRPVHSSSAFAIRAMTSEVHRMNHDTLDSRAHSSASTFASAVSDLRSVSAGSAGEPSLLRRDGNRFHHRRATSSSDHVFTTSGRFLRKQSGVPTDEGG